MLERSTTRLDAASEIEIAPQDWRALTNAADTMIRRLTPHGRVNLRLMDDAAIRALNSRFRGVDAPTDVLSFPAGPAAPLLHLGDVALSWETASRQARANGNAVLDEALALVAHGLLHLAGYDHDTDSADARMHAATLELLRAVDSEVTVFGH